MEEAARVIGWLELDAHRLVFGHRLGVDQVVVVRLGFAVPTQRGAGTVSSRVWGSVLYPTWRAGRARVRPDGLLIRPCSAVRVWYPKGVVPR